MYEIEYKVEISAEERQNLILQFKQKGFLSEGIDQHEDFYTEAKDSPLGFGYDLKRYRNESGTIIYTEKIWEMAGDEPARKEVEHEVSNEEFASEIKKYPAAVKIKKQREWFAGKYQNLNISLTIDSVKFDHSPAVRYFMEAEVVSEDKNKVKELKGKIIEFLKELLEKPDITQSPGMFTMALKKL